MRKEQSVHLHLRVRHLYSGFVINRCLAFQLFFLKISFRDSLAAQLEITLTKADSEQLARSIAEEQYSDLEKEKIMKELELKEMMARHRQELAEKDITIGSVSHINCLLQSQLICQIQMI